jgi:replicative DNA helicase
MVPTPQMLNNLDAEQLVLGALLLRNDQLAHIPDLKPGHFSEPVHGRIFESIRLAWQEGLKANPVTLKAAFDADPDLKSVGGAIYLAKCAGAAGLAVSVKDYAAAVIDLHGRRELSRVCNETLSALEFGTAIDNPVTGIAAAIARVADSVINQQVGNQVKTCLDVVEDIISEAIRFGDPIPTGYSRLDSALEGGLQKGRLYGFLARMKTGKTMILGSLAMNLAATGNKTLFIAAEMGANEIEVRNLARAMMIRQSQFRGQSLADSEILQERMRKWARGIDGKLLYQSSPGLTFSRLKSIIESAVYLHKIDGFVLDYWQLVQGDDHRQNRTLVLDEVAAWLASCVKRHGIYGITAAQLNRDGNGNARGGDGLANAADVCIEICRPDDEADPHRWLEMRQSRYTAMRNIGSENAPSYKVSEFGSHLEELPA